MATDSRMNNTPAGSWKRKGRLLWMTDTYGDKNGVSTVLTAILHEIRRRDLPVDLLVCSNTLQPEDHLIVIKSVTEFTMPVYRQQPFRIPNYLSIQRTFRHGDYNKIICSTEGPMGLAALWLKKVFSVEVSFYMHTDWMVFAKEVFSLEDAGLKMLQKILSIYYRHFDNIFVLNSDHRAWLTGKSMGFDPEHVFMTAHWVNQAFSGPLKTACNDFPFDRQLPVILFAGRISKEKGVMELPGIFRMIRSFFPEVQMVVAGTGPAEEELKKAMPEAVFLGWVAQDCLPSLYKISDILLLPSWFDTFSCVVLEALNSGLPVIAYNTKGPKDILVDSVNGYLVGSGEEMAGKVVEFFLDPVRQNEFRLAALNRSEDFNADQIMDRLLLDAGITTESILV
jgi:glycosyltransferase involved in cell wall biosynthesis